MAKLIPVIVGVTGVSAVSAGGVVLYRRANSTESKSDKTPAVKIEFKVPKGEESDIEKFRKNPSSYDCVKNTFGGIVIKNKGEEIKSEIKDSFFKTDSVEDDQFKSCANVKWNWKKVHPDNPASQEWTAQIIWLWTFQRGSEGFISFTVADTTKNESLRINAGFYLVEKNTDGKWEVKHKKEVLGDGKMATSDKKDSFFPSSREQISDEIAQYWSFFDNSDVNYKNCVGETQCTKTGDYTFNWKKKQTADKESLHPGEWCMTLDWWKNIYEVENHWKLEDKIKDIKGTWTKA